jgi:predicted dehydrogenase
MLRPRLALATIVFAVAIHIAATALAKEGPLRVGIIGCDTSHVIAFTKIINNPEATGALAEVEVTTAFPGGSPDIPESRNRIDGFVKQLREKGIKIVDSLEALANETDAILLESVDGRPHLAQFRAVAKGKPIFVDKPAAGSLADLVTIYRIAEETHTPVFSSSSLRFAKEIQAAAADKTMGDMIGCETSSPMSMEKHHPDLFWYGIHGVESLYTLMGTGCESVTRVDSPLSTVVVGKWKDGRLGSYRGERNGHYYAFTVYGTKGALQGKTTGGYDQAVDEICKFFLSGKPPVSAEETIEIYAFMEAADESKRLGGGPASIEETIHKAQRRSLAGDIFRGDK